ncbi:DUF4922 domain-containing protein [Gemmatimonadota bacterium]
MNRFKASLQEAVESLYQSQKRDWPEFFKAVSSLKKVRCRDVKVDRRTVRLQFNPRRIANALAPASPAEVAARPCFLCTENRPKEQDSFPFEKRWLVVCNPFPLFERHLVVIDREHTPQSAINGTLGAMVRFTRESGYATLYNGPRSGASAPDHLHFQALPPGSLPLERQVPVQAAASHDGIFFDPHLPRRIFLAANNIVKLKDLFSSLIETWSRINSRNFTIEPDMNLVVLPRDSDSLPLVVVHPRLRHRPAAYYAPGADRLLVSPGAADMAGLVIVPRREDFDRLDGRLIRGIFEEVCLESTTFSSLATELENRSG